MKKINQVKDLENISRAVTFGKFDGVHLGHRKLMRKITEKKKEGLKATVFSFDKAPGSILSDNNDDVNKRAILTSEERENILSEVGIDTLFEYQVNLKNLSMPAEKFVTDIIRDALKAEYIAVGEDFHFGYKRQGNVRLLKQMADECGFEIEVVKKEQSDGKIISSSRIRECLKNGNIEKANALLGYAYSAGGVIVKGNQLGRTWNIPTINIPWNEAKLEIKYGVYYSEVIIDGKEYFGMTNFGRKPTIEGEYAPTLETYLYDCDEDLYGKSARVYFKHFRRSEQKFESIEKLKTQLYSDVEAGRQLIKSYN